MKIPSTIVPRPLGYLFLLLLSAGRSLAGDFYHYKPVKVTDDIYLLESSNERGIWVTGNAVVIINEQDVLVLDSGFLPSAARDIIAEIKKLTDKPVKFLVNSHWHGDHWQGNGVFAETYPGLEIVTSAFGYEAMATKGLLWLNKNYAEVYEGYIARCEKLLATGKFSNGRIATEKDIENFKNSVLATTRELAEIKSVKPVLPTVTFSQRLTIRRGAREIQLHYLGYGNTIGDTIIYLPKERILLSGDLVVYPSPYESDSFSREWLEVMKKLRAFEFDTLIPGHGPVLQGKGYVDFLIALFEEIIRETNAAVNSGKTLDETKKLVTPESVTAELTKNPANAEFLKNFDGSFVGLALERAYPKAKEGKL